MILIVYLAAAMCLFPLMCAGRSEADRQACRRRPLFIGASLLVAASVVPAVAGASLVAVALSWVGIEWPRAAFARWADAVRA